MWKYNIQWPPVAYLVRFPLLFKNKTLEKTAISSKPANDMGERSEKVQFSGAVQEIQTLFFDVFAKFENFETEQTKQEDLVKDLKNE